MTETTTSDADLVAAWLGGDRDAFASIYDRYTGGIYAFAMSRLHNPAEAADVVQETFVRAATALAQLRDRTRLRAWLYAIARNRVIDARRRPMQYVDDEEFAEMPADQPEVAEIAARSELAELLRVAAEGLNARDREILGLHLRHGLDGADLADVLGVSPANLYVSMSRLKERMAKSIGALLIARHGSKDCPDLAALLSGWDGTFSLDVRAKVTRHVESCAACASRRTALVTAASLSAGAFAIPFATPAHVRADLLAQLVTTAPTASAAPVGNGRGQWRADGFPTARRRWARSVRPARRATRLQVAAVSSVACVIGFAGVLFLDARSNDGSAQRISSAPLDTSAPPGTTPESQPTSTIAPASSPLPPNDSTTEPVPTTSPVTTTPEIAASPAPTTTTAPVEAAAAGPIAVEVAAPLHVPNTPPVTAVVPTGPPAPSSPVQTAPTNPGVAAPPSVATTVPPATPTTPAEPPATTAPLTSPPPAPTTTAPPPPTPGRIVVLASTINLGETASSAPAQLRNDGGSAASWSAQSNLGGFTVSPASGDLAPGQTISVQIGVDRSSLSEGAHSSDVVVSSPGGGGSITVSATVERAPVINSFVRTPPIVRNSISCGPTLVNVSVTASDESGIASVEVLWSSDGTFAQRTTLSPNGGGSYTGAIGSFSKLGTNTFTAQVLDTRGNMSSAQASVNVIPC